MGQAREEHGTRGALALGCAELWPPGWPLMPACPVLGSQHLPGTPQEQHPQAAPPALTPKPEPLPCPIKSPGPAAPCTPQGLRCARAGWTLSHPPLVMNPFQLLPAQFPEAEGEQGPLSIPCRPVSESPLPSWNPQKPPGKAAPHLLQGMGGYPTPWQRPLPPWPQPSGVGGSVGTRAGDAGVAMGTHGSAGSARLAQHTQPAAAISCPPQPSPPRAGTASTRAETGWGN